MSKTLKILLIGFLFFLLILVRFFSQKFLYDPFIEYFKHDYLNKPIPEFSNYKLFFNMMIRYAINSIISLAIIWLAFKKMNYLRFSVKFYVIAFIFLSFAFFTILNGELKQGYLLAFYIRRFIIHPLFVLILLPAFYFNYQKKDYLQ